MGGSTVKKEWFFDRVCGEQIVVYAEDGKLVEIEGENEKNGAVLGNIYKGKVANVVPGMQAAFINCGMARNCYLPLDEGAARFASYDGSGSSPVRDLKEGDEVLVQVVKAPRGNKGAKVSLDLSLVGKTLIYLPKTDFLGISRKIEDPDIRTALLKEAERQRLPGEGFILRTAAANATRRHLKTECEFLRRIYRSAMEAARTAPVGTAVYREADLPFKVLRDSLGDGATKLYVADKELYERILTFARMRPDLGEKRVVHYTGAESMYKHFGLSEQIFSLSQSMVRLENGAYLIFDRTEAMTVVDVNTGKFTGENDLESTVFETNLLAAREIARQVRLRNVGGIVAVDFIDMTEEEHRTAVTEELERALSFDRSKCRVLPMNDLCVTLFTRKRTSREIASMLLQPCRHCGGRGEELSDLYMALLIRSALLDCFAEGYRSAIVELNDELLKNILKDRYFRSDVMGAWSEKRVYLIPNKEFMQEKFTVRGDNSDALTLPDTAQILY